jgi:SnoaL-like domain
MPERSGREFAEAWVEVLERQEFDRFEDFLAADCVHEYPQSGERIVGLANIRAIFENYPGGLVGQDLTTLQVSGDDGRWLLAPNFTLVRITGSGNSYTSALRVRYPDGSMWYVITMFELLDGKMIRGSLYFAPFFDPPEWRKPYVEAGSHE